MDTTEPDGDVRPALGEAMAGDWVSAAKKKQAHEADHLAGIASGIGEYGVANACYRLAAILRRHAHGDYSSMMTGGGDHARDARTGVAEAAEKDRIAQVAEDLDAHYHGDGQSASFADYLRGASHPAKPARPQKEAP